LRHLATHTYKGEGWGLTSDGEKLYMSDGTNYIRVLNPETLAQERRFGVTLRGESLSYLNELEWIEGKIWANVYTTNHIVIINPENGVVEGVVDLSGILPDKERDNKTDVLNGIAYDKATKRIFVTGKNWSKLYEIKIIAQ
jgi:glutamine cyclotransferase